jgi:hypothetical protein
VTAAPRPSLTYRQPSWAAWPGEGIEGEGPPLAVVHEVNVHAHSGDVWARGRMRCKDGHVGPSRGVLVRCDLVQPIWLQEIITDALARLCPQPLDDRRPS